MTEKMLVPHDWTDDQIADFAREYGAPAEYARAGPRA